LGLFCTFIVQTLKNMTNITITQELVKNLFYYKDGFLYRKTNVGKTKIGDLAGCIMLKDGKKRRVIAVNKKLYYSSRLIFLFHHGYLPEVVDHKDRDTTNENIKNLRAATPIQNIRNTQSHIDSVSKYKGVTLKKSTNRWGANIYSSGKLISLGYHKTQEEAALAYNEAAIKFHGEFANLNQVT